MFERREWTQGEEGERGVARMVEKATCSGGGSGDRSKRWCGREIGEAVDC